MGSRVVFWLILFAFLSGCSEPSLAVRGDSTAIGSREGVAKIWNLAPSYDYKRWWNILGSEHLPRYAVFNDGVGGQSISTMRDKMLADEKHRALLTIIYDRRNDGEDPVEYVNALAAAVETLETTRFLILPQVARSGDESEEDDQISAMSAIDQAVTHRWPENTFSPVEREAFVEALSSDTTRFDGLHRNAHGQAIEAKFIGGWLRSRGW
jgi:hypothetical protein